MVYIKNHIPWNKDKKRPPFSNEWKENMRLAHMGKTSGAIGKRWKLSEETKVNQSNANKLRIKNGTHNFWKGGNGYHARRAYARRFKPERCDVCKMHTKDNRRGLHYDHDHKTGKFRGWLCAGCNVAIGFAKDNPKTLIALAKYLIENKNK